MNCDSLFPIFRWMTDNSIDQIISTCRAVFWISDVKADLFSVSLYRTFRSICLLFLFSRRVQKCYPEAIIVLLFWKDFSTTAVLYR